MDKKTEAPVLPVSGRYSLRRSKRTSHPLLVAVFAIVLYQSFWTLFGDRFRRRDASFSLSESGPSVEPSERKWREHTEVDWDSITPSTQLEFVNCYDGPKCARLKLPLDYWNGTRPLQSMVLAVVMLPAKVPVTDPRYAGPILINPGGPGGSGIDFALGTGQLLQTLVDSSKDPRSEEDPEASQAKYFDIVSFDPRGVGLSSPVISCFETKPQRESWGLRLLNTGLVGSADSALWRLWNMQHAFGLACADVSQEEDDIQHYLTTASVSRDMLMLVERLGEWREDTARRILDRPRNLKELPMPPELLYSPGEEKIQYWGFSYGTFLGTTFASMYPDRIKRMVLDGVVDAEDYITATWSNSMDDTEKVMDWFYERCAAAGPEVCSLAKDDSTAADDVRSTVETVLKSLYHNPQSIPSNSPDVISWSEVKSLILIAIYSPMSGFYTIADILSSLHTGDGSALIPYAKALHSYSCSGSDPETHVRALRWDATPAIACGDASDIRDVNITQFDKFWRKLVEKSETAGYNWASIHLLCTGWQTRPLYSYRGPFKGETSAPILWVGNTADPVTPVSAAKKMSKSFPGSVVLTQNSPGHCSLSAFSTCTVDHVRNYFHDAALPPPDTVCEIEQLPFGDERLVVLSEEDTMRLKTHKGVSDFFSKGRHGFGMGFLGV